MAPGTATVRQRLRRLLVVAEVTLAVIVLVASGLLLRSFLAMTRVPLGFDANGTVAVQLTLPRASYDSAPKIYGFNQALIEKLTAQPGVVSASAIYPLPSSGDGWSGSLFIEGQPVPEGQPEPHAAYAVAMPDYFKTLRVDAPRGPGFRADGRRGRADESRSSTSSSRSATGRANRRSASGSARFRRPGTTTGRR